MRRCALTLEAEMTAEEQALLLRAVQMPAPLGRALEVGTGAGGSLCAMLSAFSPSQRPIFTAVDTMRYFPAQMEAIRRNLVRHGLDPASVDFRIGRSQDLLEPACRAGIRFDFILIDGSHKIPAVTADLKWTRLLNPGGVLCLHDFCARFPGVWLATRLFLARHSNYLRVAQSGSLLVLRKSGPSARPEMDRFDEWFAAIMSSPLRIFASLIRLRQKDQ